MDTLRKRKNQSGFSLIEILLAMTLALIAISGVILASGAVNGGTNAAIGVGQDTLVGAETNKEAELKAQAILEKAISDGRENFDTLSDATFPADGIYSRTLTVVPDGTNPDIKKLTSTVTWTLGGRTLNVALSSLVTNPSGAAKCSPTITGDWSNPTILGTADVGENNGASDVFVLKKKLYVTASPSAAAKPEFYIVDITDPSVEDLPVYPNPLNLGSYGARAVFAQGDYAFVATEDPNAQLQIINVSDPSNPVLTKTLKVAGVTSGSGKGLGRSVYIKNNILYLGLTKTAVGEKELHAYDLTGFLANPATPPVELGTGWAAGADINEIIIAKEGTMYIATNGDVANVYALNITTPSAITAVNQYLPPEDPSSHMNGLSLTLNRDEDRLYLSRSGSGGTDKEFYVLNASPITLATPIASRDVSSDDVNAAAVRGDLAFLMTSESSQELKIYQLSNLSGPVYGSLNLQANPTGGFDCFGNLLYIGEKSNKAVQIVGPAPQYSLVSGGDVTVQQGTSGNTTISTILTGGYAPKITLSATVSPAGGPSISYSNNPCKPTCANTITVTANAATPVGDYTYTITGSPASSPAASATFVVHVTAQPFDYTLSNSGPVNVTQGSSGSTNVTVTRTAGTAVGVTKAVVSGLPVGANATYTNNPCTPSPSCVGSVTITTTAATPVGTYPIVIGGTPSGVSASQTSFNLVVSAPTFDYSLSATPATLSFTKAAPGTETITVTKIGSAAALPVTVTLSGFPAQVSGSPVSQTCTPTTGTCSVTFTLSVSNNGHKTGPITVSGTSPARSTTFNIIAN